MALDATTLGTRFTVMAISVVYRGCAIPVAWTVLADTAKHAWRREWLRMLRQIRRAVPRSWTVIVWRIVDCMPAGCFGASHGWGGTSFCATTPERLFGLRATCVGESLKSLVPETGMAWQGTGIAFKGVTASGIAPCWHAGRREKEIPG